MALCSYCDAPYPERRKALGYNICVECSKTHPKVVKRALLPLYNKGAYQVAISKQDLKNTTKRTQD